MKTWHRELILVVVSFCVATLINLPKPRLLDTVLSFVLIILVVGVDRENAKRLRE
jgi:hypothetical protein